MVLDDLPRMVGDARRGRPPAGVRGRGRRTCPVLPRASHELRGEPAHVPAPAISTGLRSPRSGPMGRANGSPAASSGVSSAASPRVFDRSASLPATASSACSETTPGRWWRRSARLPPVPASRAPHPRWACASMLGRFGQLDPAVLVVSSIGQPQFEESRLRELAGGLPTLRGDRRHGRQPAPLGSAGARPPGRRAGGRRGDVGALSVQPSAVRRCSPRARPGRPKCIVHGAGGTLLEHLKEHRLHGDLRAGDKLFFHTSTAWMMWNWQLSALACGAEIVLYDGPVIEPDDAVAASSAEERVTVFGTSPAVPPAVRAAPATAPRRGSTSPSLRSMHVAPARSCYDDSSSGRGRGRADSAAVDLGRHRHRRLLRARQPEPARLCAARRSAGASASTSGRSARHRGDAASASWSARRRFRPARSGSTTIPAGERFHDAYFAQHPGVWTHGDLIEITRARHRADARPLRRDDERPRHPDRPRGDLPRARVGSRRSPRRWRSNSRRRGTRRTRGWCCWW